MGLVLLAACIVSTLWLTITGQLGLYIHPRYFVFTGIMAVIGLVATVAGFALRPADAAEEHDHDHGSAALGDRADGPAELPAARASLRARASRVAVAAVVTVTVVAVLVLPPRTLTQSTVTQRALNSSTVASDAAPDQELLGTSDFSTLGVKDWSQLLAQTTDPTFFTSKSVDITGFVSADPDDPDDVFYVTRFVVTCCAVDAQPVGVPVYQPGWKSTLQTDEWVRVTGPFASNPSAKSRQPLAVMPQGVQQVDQPADPYVY
ncbi:TIGR03943 family protein [Clavibacter michiganensis]|nr:TIGR03943 family protein [Clavibacter michiganensis subsp. michiganensis]UGY90064.1 TIGR03943 family protein [Clavibacter michiganensis]MWJ07599.1 TIGR03943 family protein [Clavibacter michiganensis subsp. michiganensis]MWJ26440.1 TIGR03943 family protein [Clavibacter michiganensis subsp. michiganensis]MWJ88693.1 TIGR03943 family protein [Clavibacter michiganensis subsp. michiganensis]